MASFDLVRPYFRARMDSLGYREWADQFEIDNVPETIADKSYHIKSRIIDANSQSMQPLVCDQEAVLTVIFRGFTSVMLAEDAAHVGLDTIVKDLLKPSNRLSGTDGLRNVTFRRAEIDAINLENDNSIKLTITFNCLTAVDIC